MSRYILLLGALSLATAIKSGLPCSVAKEPCPIDMHCIPADPNCTDYSHCKGTCEFRNQYPSCGGYRVGPKSCRSDEKCVDDPRQPEVCGMACDAPGICLPPKPKPCGGFAGFRCPAAMSCYDDPTGPCRLSEGVADCLGICL